ncbi:STAS domain-containing protein [Streptomyces sp. NPDC100445]|uniref:STAS domain-containing protein n=1 Tax=Streptomyces sp. NPDC100445 TaxID=3366102 RepID=UPI00382C252D
MPDHQDHDPSPATVGQLTTRTERWGEGGFAITVTGDLDRHTTTRLTDCLRSVPRTPAPTVLLDLSGVTFIDSTGLTCLLQAQRAVTGTGGRLELIAPSPRVTHMPDITGIGQVFTVHPDLRAAHDGTDAH